MSDPISAQSAQIKNANYVADLNRQNSREINDTKEGQKQLLDTMTDRHQQLVKEKEKAYEVELGFNTQRFDSEIAELQKRQQSRLEQTKKSGDRELEELKSSYAKQMNETRMNSEKILGRLREELEDSKKNMSDLATKKS